LKRRRVPEGKGLIWVAASGALGGILPNEGGLTRKSLASLPRLALAFWRANADWSFACSEG
jgi:hypothetical protein